MSRMPDYLNYSTKEVAEEDGQHTNSRSLLKSIWSNLYLLLVPLQATVSLLSVLVVADRIPLNTATADEGTTFLSKGIRGGITVGEIQKQIPFEFANNQKLLFEVIAFLFISFVVIGSLYSLSVLLQKRGTSNYPARSVHLWVPLFYLSSLWLAVAYAPGIHFCDEQGLCQNTVLFFDTPFVMLFPAFAGLQSLVVGIVAWVYKHEFAPDDITDLRHHMDSWWRRVKSLNQLLLILAVNLSIPFALNRTGLGLWALAWTVLTFGLAVSLILYFSFRKARAVEEQINSR